MNFDSFKDAITGAWEFLWSPVVTLFVIVALFAWLAPDCVSRLNKRLDAVRTTIRGIVAKESFIGYGVQKLSPVIVLFTVVFILYAAHSVATAIGEILPGQLVYRPYSYTVTHIDNHLLGCYWAHHPAIDKAAELLRTLEGEAETPIASYWTQKARREMARFMLCKFFLFLSLALSIFQPIASRLTWRVVMKATCACTIFLVLSGMFFVRQLFAQEQALIIDTQKTYDVLMDTATGCQVQESEKFAERLRLFGASYSWWDIELDGSEYPRWLARTVADHFRRGH